MYFMYFCTKMTLFDRYAFRGFSLWDRSYNIIHSFFILFPLAFVRDVCGILGFCELSVARYPYIPPFSAIFVVFRAFCMYILEEYISTLMILPHFIPHFSH